MLKRARVIVIKDQQVLTIRRVKPSETYWVFPGGEVEAGETPAETAVRECLEETGLNVEIKGLLLEHDWQHYADPSGPAQRISYYICHEIDGVLGTGTGPEYYADPQIVGQHIPEYLPLSDIFNIDLRPAEVRDLLIQKFNQGQIAK